MPRALTVAPHLSLAEVQERFRKEDDPVARTHWQVVMMAMKGAPSKEIVNATTYGRDWVFVILKRYNERGPSAIGDGRAKNGKAPMMSDEDLYALAEALQDEPPGGGLWSGPKVARWMGERLGRRVHPQRGWDYLRRLGFRLKVPRPSHASADPEAQEAFKRGASQRRSSGSNESTRTRRWRSGAKTKRASA